MGEIKKRTLINSAKTSEAILTSLFTVGYPLMLEYTAFKIIQASKRMFLQPSDIKLLDPEVACSVPGN